MKSMYLNVYPKKLENIIKAGFWLFKKITDHEFCTMDYKPKQETSRDERKQAKLSKAFDEKSKIISKFNPH